MPCRPSLIAIKRVVGQSSLSDALVVILTARGRQLLAGLSPVAEGG